MTDTHHHNAGPRTDADAITDATTVGRVYRGTARTPQRPQR